MHARNAHKPPHEEIAAIYMYHIFSCSPHWESTQKRGDSWTKNHKLLLYSIPECTRKSLLHSVPIIIIVWYMYMCIPPPGRVVVVAMRWEWDTIPGVRGASGRERRALHFHSAPVSQFYTSKLTQHFHRKTARLRVRFARSRKPRKCTCTDCNARGHRNTGTFSLRNAHITFKCIRTTGASRCFCLCAFCSDCSVCGSGQVEREHSFVWFRYRTWGVYAVAPRA